MKRALIFGLVQVLAILGWAARNEHVRATAPTFRIPLQPRDPFDVVRGRYFILSPQDQSLRVPSGDVALTEAALRQLLKDDESWSGTAEVGFCPVGVVHRVCALRRIEDGPSGDAAYWSRGIATVFREDVVWRDGKEQRIPGFRVNVELGLDRFFLPNRIVLPGQESEPGWELEVSHRPGQAPMPKRLWFKGQPLRES
jgi:hypothetical protein